MSNFDAGFLDETFGKRITEQITAAELMLAFVKKVNKLNDRFNNTRDILETQKRNIYKQDAEKERREPQVSQSSRIKDLIKDLQKHLKKSVTTRCPKSVPGCLTSAARRCLRLGKIFIFISPLSAKIMWQIDAANVMKLKDIKMDLNDRDWLFAPSSWRDKVFTPSTDSALKKKDLEQFKKNVRAFCATRRGWDL